MFFIQKQAFELASSKLNMVKITESMCKLNMVKITKSMCKLNMVKITESMFKDMENTELHNVHCRFFYELTLLQSFKLVGSNVHNLTLFEILVYRHSKSMFS